MNSRSKILFVDSEPQTLEALQRLLQDEPWDCRFVAAAAEALALLEQEPVDLVISSAVTAERDGIDLLSEIRRSYPAVIRMLLTSSARQDLVIRALAAGQTQQIIPKPWINQELKEILRSALRQALQQKRYSPQFQRLINSAPLLPTLPETYNNVCACITGDEIDIEKMAEHISRDVSLSSILLHWGNSALFGQRFLVDSIKKAIIVLGTDIVENLVLSEAVNQAINAQSSKIARFDMMQFRKHSMATATIARLLIKTLYSGNIAMQDRAFTAGLLHDIGKLFLAGFLPQQLQAALEAAYAGKIPLTAAEQTLYGTDHTEVGAFLAQWWSLPPFLVDAIRAHHQPRMATPEVEVVAATYVANLLSYQLGFGSNGGTLPRAIDDNYRDLFYLTEEGIEILWKKTTQTVQELVP